MTERAGRTRANQIVSGDWFVIPGSGTGGLAGLRGEGGFRASLGEKRPSPPGLLVRMTGPPTAPAPPAPGQRLRSEVSSAP